MYPDIQVAGPGLHDSNKICTVPIHHASW